MENQHQQIKGYRDLTQTDIDLMNEWKEFAEKVGAFVAKLRELPNSGPSGACLRWDASGTPQPTIDQRWVSIGEIGRAHV